MHILILTDRDWNHPETGGTGVHLTGQIDSWLAWGHHVTVITGGYPGAPAFERDGRLTVYRRGTRITVFPRTVLRGLARRVPEPDVTLEIINGITWLTPLWLRSPRVAVVHHVHREQYISELGLLGRVAAAALETLPLRLLYRHEPFIVVSEATKAELSRAHGIPADAIEVVYPGVDTVGFVPGEKTSEPSMLFLGRLKAYKRIELLLDVVERIDGLSFDIAGDGDHGPALEAEVERRGLTGRVHFHGHVDDATKRTLLQGAWVAATASAAEGWSSATMEAAASGTPTVAFPVGGLRESIIDGRTGFHADDRDDFVAIVRRLVTDDELRERISRQARERACRLSWEAGAERILGLLRRAAPDAPADPSSPPESAPSLLGSDR